MAEVHDTVPGNSGRRAPTCPGCGKALADAPNFCPVCGADLRGVSDTLDGSATPRPIDGRLIDGRYRLLEKLGEGGMGAVFKVEHVRMGKIAALKLLRADSAVDKGLKARFLQEARIVARLSHPNTVQVFDSGETDDGGLFLTMEYVPGHDLAWHLAVDGPMPEAQVISIGAQILASLQEAHDAGVIHRDIKPANVMYERRGRGREGRVKLLDFGIAKLQEAEGRKSTTGDFVGTPAYMSPEQIRGEGLDARSDLYSLGALLFELLSGRQPFVGPTPIHVVTQHTTAPVPSLAEVAPAAHVSPGLEAVLHRALAKKADARFPDAEAMREALLDLRQPDAPPPEPTPRPSLVGDNMLSREDFDRFERRLRLRRAAWPVLAATLVVAGSALAWRIAETHHADAPRTEEVEPNDTPAQATRFTTGVDVRGAIGAGVPGANDRDLFVTTVPAGAYRLTLSAVPDLNLTVEVLQLERRDDAERLRRRLFLDDVGPGGPERVDALALEAGDVYLRVEERPFATEPQRPSREKALVPYALRLEPLDGVLEVEPNDAPSTAQALPMTKSVEAFTGAVIDVDALARLRAEAPPSSADWFRVDAPPPPARVLVVVVPPERGSLAVLEGDDAAARKKPLRVEGQPLVFEPRPDAAGALRFRVTPTGQTEPGAAYRLAVAASSANGVAAVLDLAQRLEDAGRTDARAEMLKAVASKLGDGPDAARLADAVSR